MVLRPCPNLCKRVKDLPDQRSNDYWAALGFSQTTKDHGTCDEDECRANDMNLDKYTTKHVQDNCECKFLGPDPATLVSIYAAGCFPLVSYKTCNGISSVQVRAYEEGLHYVAISHALSDGMGNVDRPALPTCQLAQIDASLQSINTAKDASDRVCWFWMDTLCFPAHIFIDTNYDEEVRASFKQSTERACCTLILDSDIQLLHQGFTYDEAFLRIYFCSWSSRMWTLQEAVLTPTVVLRFKDGLTTIEEILRIHEQSGSFLNLPTKQFTWYNELRKYRSEVSSKGLPPSVSHLEMLQEALKDRKTSNTKDKRIILCNLIGLDMQNLETIDIMNKL